MTVNVVAVDLVLLVVLGSLVGSEFNGHLDRFVLTEELASQFANSFLVDDRTHAIFQQRLSVVSPLVGRGEPESEGCKRHLGIWR